MSHSPQLLIEGYLDDGLNAEEHGLLSDWLRQSQDNVDRFVAECRLHSEIFYVVGKEDVQGSNFPGMGVRGGGSSWTADGERNDAKDDIRQVSSPFLPSFPNPYSAAPLSSIPPVPGFFSTAYHGTANFFSQDVPFACLMSALFMIAGGIIGSLITKEHYTQMPGRPAASAERSFAAADGADKPILAEEKENPYVGRITGMVDCKWSSDEGFYPPSVYEVVLGRKYKLDAGLMEITYDTGAKVLLQGPVTYEVESANGGYMAAGKLTGKVEVEKAKGFAVRTPTAVVTDLGTEFGVEVEKSGETFSHVFRGKVLLAVYAPNGLASGKTLTLVESQSARTTHENGGARAFVVSGENQSGKAASDRFVRADRLRELRAAPLEQFRRWQAFSAELREHEDLLVYYDFQRDPDGSRDENGHELLRNRAKTGQKYDGRFEGALSLGNAKGRFPGKDAVQFGMSPDGIRVKLDVDLMQLTLAAWVKLDKLPLWNSCFLSTAYPNGGYIQWNVIRNGGMWLQINHEAKKADSLLHGRSPVVFNADSMPQWHFTAFTYDSIGGDYAYYFDGEPKGVYGNKNNPPSFRFTTAMIGARILDGMRHVAHMLPGRMDELMIFKTALSAEEIRRLYEYSACATSNNK